MKLTNNFYSGYYHDFKKILPKYQFLMQTPKTVLKEFLRTLELGNHQNMKRVFPLELFL